VQAAIYAFLLFIFSTSVLLDKASRTVSIKELKRRARGSKDNNTSAIYKLASLGGSLSIFLWLLGGVSGSILFVRIALNSAALAVLAILIASWIVLSKRPLNTGGWFWKLAAIISIPVYKIVSFMHPLLIRLAKFVSRLRPVQIHTGLYDKDDLLDLINIQNHQIDNRIPEEDLKIAFGALTFGDKLVRDFMTPRREIKFTVATDAVGPLLMDELHASGFSRFPVVDAPTKEANPQIVGTLYLKDLLEHTDKGRVKDVMRKGAYYINESQNLRDALHGFLKSQRHLLVVVNNFEEISGIISLEDVMEQVLGVKVLDEFDHYENPRAVAELDAKKEHSQHSHVEVIK
jgi:CBS domain containing-hemolysin-like protein